MRGLARLPLSLVLTWTLASVPPSHAQEAWTPIGPFGGTVEALAVAPRDSRILYAGTRGGGVFRSADGGRSWERRSEGLHHLSIFSLAVDPRNANTVYAGTEWRGIAKSVDGGASWVVANVGLACGGLCAPTTDLDPDPTRPDTLYAVQGGIIFKSTDGGARWRSISAAFSSGSVPPSVSAYAFTLEIDPRSPRTLYTGTSRGIFKSTDGGVSWTLSNAGLSPSGGAPVSVTDLAIDPATPSTIYAAQQFRDRPVVKSVDGGRTWRDASQGMRGDAQVVLTLAVDPAAPRTLYAGTRSAGVYKSTNGGQTWRPASAGLGPLRVNQLVTHRAAPGLVWAATGRLLHEGAGVYRSADRASTWTAARQGLTGSNVTDVVFHPASPEVLYAATASRGVMRSRNGGAGWADTGPGLPGGAVEDLLLHPRNPAVLYAATAAGVFKSANAGASWTAKNHGLNSDIGPVPRVYSLAFHPQNPDILYAGTQEGFFRSLDGGETWQVTGLIIGLRILSIAVSPEDPDVVYAGGEPFPYSPIPLLWRSEDAGVNWAPVAIFSPVEVAAHPGDADTFLAGLSVGTLVRSTDGGAHLEVVDPGFEGTALVITAVLFDPFAPGTAYVAATELFLPEKSFVARSTDGGATWELLTDRGMTSAEIQTLAVDSRGTVYAATRGGGILRLGGGG